MWSWLLYNFCNKTSKNKILIRWGNRNVTVFWYKFNVLYLQTNILYQNSLTQYAETYVDTQKRKKKTDRGFVVVQMFCHQPTPEIFHGQAQLDQCGQWAYHLVKPNRKTPLLLQNTSIPSSWLVLHHVFQHYGRKTGSKYRARDRDRDKEREAN